MRGIEEQVGWGSLAPRTTPGSTNSRIVIGIAGFFTFENWTSPLTGSPSGNSTTGAGSSAGRRNQEEQREKRGCEYRSHIVFREVGLTTTSRSYSCIALRPSAQNPTQMQVGAGGSTLEERGRWRGPLCKFTAVQTCSILDPRLPSICWGAVVSRHQKPAREFGQMAHWPPGGLNLLRRSALLATSRGRLHGRNSACSKHIHMPVDEPV